MTPREAALHEALRELDSLLTPEEKEAFTKRDLSSTDDTERIKEEVAKTEEQGAKEWKANYLRETTVPATPVEQKTSNGNLLVSKQLLWNSEPEQLVWTRDESNTIEVDLTTITQLEEDTEELREELSNIDFLHHTTVYYKTSIGKETENQTYTLYIVPTVKENGCVVDDAEEYVEKVTSAIKSYIKLLDVRLKAKEYLEKQPEVASYALGLVSHTLDMFLAEMDEVTYPDDIGMAIVHTVSKLLSDEVTAKLASSSSGLHHLTPKAIFINHLTTYVKHIDNLNCNLTYKEQNGLYETILDMETEQMMGQYDHSYDQAKQVLAKWYVCNLESFINQDILTDITGLYPDVRLTPLGISSPREYNYSTDIVLLATNDVPIIHKALMLSDWSDDWGEWLTKVTTSYDGYISFYKKTDFDKPVSEWEDAQKCTLFNFMAFLMDREGEIQELEYEYSAYSGEIV